MEFAEVLRGRKLVRSYTEDPAPPETIGRILVELGVEEAVLLRNVVPTHPHEPDRAYTNRRPTRVEVEPSALFLEGVSRGRLLVA